LNDTGGALAVFAAYTLNPPPKVVYSLYGSLDLLHPSYNAPVNFPSGYITYDSVSDHLSPTGPIVSHSPADVDFSTMIANGRTRACFWAVQEGRVLPLATRSKEPVDLESPPSELLKYRATHLVERASEPKKQIPPTVCVHGKDDLMVPATLSKELVVKLKAVGVEAEYHEAEGKNQFVFLLFSFSLPSSGCFSCRSPFPVY
jgi:acetyl esterase/lipase